MSLKFSTECLTQATKEKIAKELEIDINEDAKPAFRGKFSKKPKKYMYPFNLVGNKITIPMAWGLKNIPDATRPARRLFSQPNYSYTANLRPEQKVIKKEALGNLNKRGTTVISAYPGFGKTVTSLNMAHKIGMRTLVLVNKVILIEQWLEAVENFTDLKKGCGVVKVAPASKSQRETPEKFKKWRNKIDAASIMVMNALTVSKLPVGFFDDVGCLIVDECHQLMSPCLSEALLYVHPRYVIALSATPYRPDGLNKLLDIYFSEERLVRELKKPHTVYEIRTGFKPTADLTEQGRLDWNALLNSQSEDEGRNQMIIDAAVELSKTRTILILTKRVDQAAYLESKLKKEGINVDGLYGTKKKFDKTVSVLIGTASKIGVGFDHKSLDCLILASDVEAYFIQFLGRVFRREDVEPIILDFVDTNPTIRKHFRTRKAVYLKHGGKIVTIKKGQNLVNTLKF
tara:strand:+ start:1533 stop:2906 length:1374 start_codon:yes stop_codon:yes gene_type:complete